MVSIEQTLNPTDSTAQRAAQAPPLNWTVSQIGSRQHYAVPRAFARTGHLRRFYTDAWCRRGRTLLQRGPKALRAVAGRFHADVPRELVVDFTKSLMLQRLANRQHDRWLSTGKAFGQKVRRHLEKESMHPEHDAFFTFNTGALEPLELMKQRGILSIVDQMDPAKVEEDLICEERARWPGWENDAERIPAPYWERLKREWEIASLVLVNSEWTKRAMIVQGVPSEKCVVVPMAYEGIGINRSASERYRGRGERFTVLWLGQVNLRKGIAYLIEAARLLKDTDIRFVVAGPVFISETAIASAPSNVDFVGRITRDRLSDYYGSADVFVLPTLSDGFAITQLEAMAHGLPVITTPNCGDVVTHGEDGFIVPARDAATLAKTIASLADERQRLEAMSQRAVEKSGQFTLSRFAQRVEATLDHLRTH